MRSFYKYCCCLIALSFCSSALATNHTESWNSAIIIGSLSKDKKIKYYLQPGLTFEDDEAKFRSAFFYLGVGYQTTPRVIMWLMDGGHYRIRANGSVENINTIRQQVDWQAIIKQTFSVTSLSRLEERKNYSQPEWSLRARERLILRVPFTSWPNHSFVTFDEVFLNLNTPAWVSSNNFLAHNDAFIGIGTQLSKTVSFDFGYLNQFVTRNAGNQDNNVIYLQFHVGLE